MSIQGKGRLTKERIDSFQVFYGKALHDNKGDAAAMSRATMAILKHYSDRSLDEQHEDCPDGEGSWCKYKSGLESTSPSAYLPIKNPIAPALYDVLLPTFTALSDQRLLRACQAAKSQNANESLHGVIWSLCPKDLYHSPQEVSFGINLAVMVFNNGQSHTFTSLLERANIPFPNSSTNLWQLIDNKRIQESERKQCEEVRQVRKEKRKANVRQLDAFKRVEGETYKSGAFHSMGTPSEPEQSGRIKRTPMCKACKLRMKGHPRGKCNQLEPPSKV